MSIANLAALPEGRVPFDRISLRRLVLIRWVAIAGQAVTLLVVHYAFDFRVPLLPAFLVVGASVALNLITSASTYCSWGSYCISPADCRTRSRS